MLINKWRGVVIWISVLDKYTDQRVLINLDHVVRILPVIAEGGVELQLSNGEYVNATKPQIVMTADSYQFKYHIRDMHV